MTTLSQSIQHKVIIESIDLEGKGVARIDGKTVFVDGALPHEEVTIEIYKKKKTFDMGRLISIELPSKDRQIPQCPNFGVCGGCSMQHLDFSAQIYHKQKVLVDNLKHIGGVAPLNVLPSIIGVPWGYRHKARFSVRYVHKKDSVLVGFRERGSSYVANMNECHVVPKHVSNLIPQFRDLLYKLAIRDKIPQIEVSVGDNVSVFIFRVMCEMAEEDGALIHQFVSDYNQIHDHPIQIWLQPKGLDSCYLFAPQDDTKHLSYTIDAFNIKMPYYPTEFTQVNPYVNNHMVSTAIKLLDLNADDSVFDFFCGIGNFTLPIAKMCQNVTGIEGNEVLVKRAFENAKYNNLENKTHYMATNLFTVTQEWLVSLGRRNKWLIDPPRDGAMELIKAITPDIAPEKIVYVSCNPSTLARDASILVNTHGYTLKNAMVLNMFPHTSHVESIA